VVDVNKINVKGVEKLTPRIRKTIDVNYNLMLEVEKHTTEKKLSFTELVHLALNKYLEEQKNANS
jgi:hypothetical protein